MASDVMPVVESVQAIERAQHDQTLLNHGSSLCLTDLPLDILVMVVACLTPDSALALGSTCQCMVEVSRTEAIWRWHVRELATEHPLLTVGRREGERAFEHFLNFRAGIECSRALDDARLLADFKQNELQLRSLERFGVITGRGTAEAAFSPFGGKLPIQVPSIVALELLKLMQTVPSEKGVCIGSAAAKAACVLGVSRSSVEALARRAKSRRRQRLVKLLREPFPMEYIPKSGVSSASAKLEAHCDVDGELVTEVMTTQPGLLSPRKLAMRRALQKSRGQIEELEAEKRELEHKHAHEREALALRLASDNRELNRMRKYVSELEMSNTTALRAQIRSAKRSLQRQEQVQAAVEKHAESLARQLQKARDASVTDYVYRRQTEARAQMLLNRAEQQVAEARAAEQRAKTSEQAAIAAAQEAAREAQQVVKRKHREWLAKQHEDAIAQAAAGNCDEHLTFLAGCVMSTVRPGTNKRFKQANASHRGPGYSVMRIIQAKKGFADLGHSQSNARSHTLSGMMVEAAGREDHVVALMVHHKKSNPELYKQIGLKQRVSLSCEQMVSICVKMTGALGKAVNRVLRQAGIDVASNAEVQRALRCSDHSHETAKITWPNTNTKTNKKYPFIHGGVVRVTDLGKVLQTTTDQHVESGDHEWPGCIPSSEVWIEFLSDKGGTTDKLAAKFLCCRAMDSVSHLVLLALADGIGDDYYAKRVAFGPVYKQLDNLRSTRFTIHTPWKPRLPDHITLRADGLPIYRPVELAKPRKGQVVEARVSVTSSRLGVQYVHLRVRPRAVWQSTSEAKTSKLIVPNIFGKSTTPKTEIRKRPSTMPREGSPEATGKRLSMPEDETGDICPAAECEGSCHHQWRYPAKSQRLSHCLIPGPGAVMPVVDRGPPIRLKGCTYNADCEICSAEPDGELHALRRQVSECTQRGRAPRLVRFFHGGDLLSIEHPMGLQGPTSTSFCHVCHGRLNQTNAAGVPASRELLEGFNDTRPAHIRDPPRRLGTQAIRQACKLLHEARRAYAAGQGRKPTEAAFHSCINPPLFHMNVISDEAALIPLHVMLGQGLRIFNTLESICKQMDAQIAEFLGLVVEDDKVKEAILTGVQKIEGLHASLQEAMQERSSHEHGIELIRSTPGAEEAIQRGLKAPRGPQPYEPLPLESEFRAHNAGLIASNAKISSLSKQLDAEKKKVAEHRATEPGRYEMRFLDEMKKLRLKREAYFGGCFVGDDIHAVFDPEVIERFTAIIGEPHIATRVKLASNGEVIVNLLTVGSRATAQVLRELCLSFSDAMALFGRGTPLCEHHIADFKKRTNRFARAFAIALPKEHSQPKTHILCAEMPDQAERIGGPGMLGEGAIEAMHVRDNSLKRRYATTTEICENLRLRACVYDRMADTRVANISAIEERAATQKRKKMSEASRKRKNHARKTAPA